MDNPPLTKQTSVKVTIGTIIAVVLAGVTLDRRFGHLEAAMVVQENLSATTRRRQDTYIDRRDAQHDHYEDELTAIHDRLDALCEELAARFVDVVCG